jgi:hypothetical protein
MSGRRLIQLGDGRWAVLVGNDRRRRVLAMLTPDAGRALVDSGEVQPAEGSGYVLVSMQATREAPMPGPSVFIAAGLPRSNTGGAGFAGLARRAGGAGDALSLRQAQAGVRLVADAERAARTPGLAMDWSASPASRVRRAGRDGGLVAASRDAARRIERLRAGDAEGFALAWAACVEGLSLARLERRFQFVKRSAAAKLAEALETIAAGYDGVGRSKPSPAPRP